MTNYVWIQRPYLGFPSTDSSCIPAICSNWVCSPVFWACLPQDPAFTRFLQELVGGLLGGRTLCRDVWGISRAYVFLSGSTDLRKDLWHSLHAQIKAWKSSVQTLVFAPNDLLLPPDLSDTKLLNFTSELKTKPTAIIGIWQISLSGIV